MNIKGIFGLLFMSSVLCMCAPARADRVDDLRNGDPEKYCYSVAQVFHDGTDFHSVGAAKQVKNITREDYEKKLAEGIDAPLDGIYYIDFDNYTDQEKAYITDNVYAGWDFAAQFPDPEAIVRGTDVWMNKCMKELADHKNDKETSNDIIKAASNDRLYRHSPNTPQQEYCTDISVRRYNECMSGVLVK